LNLNKIILLSIFTIVVYTVIVLFADINILYKEFVNLKSEFLVVALAPFSLGYIIRSLRRIIMLRYLQIKIPFLKNLIIYFSGYAFALTPRKIGE